MIARAALNRPWLFNQVRAALAGQPIPPEPTLAEERALLLHHHTLVCRRFGEAKGTVLMRKYACCYAQGRFGAREFRTRSFSSLVAGRIRGHRGALFSSGFPSAGSYGQLSRHFLGPSCNLLLLVELRSSVGA